MKALLSKYGLPLDMHLIEFITQTQVVQDSEVVKFFYNNEEIFKEYFDIDLNLEEDPNYYDWKFIFISKSWLELDTTHHEIGKTIEKQDYINIINNFLEEAVYGA